MLRTLLLVLLLANLLLLGARQGWLGDGLSAAGQADREPLRLQRQVNPGAVKVLPAAAAKAVPGVANGASAPAAAGALAGSAVAAAPSVAAPASSAASSAAASAASVPAAAPLGRATSGAAGTVTPAAVAAADLRCLEAGPFNATDAPAAERVLRTAGVADASWQVLPTDDTGRYMVYMGRYADAEQLQRKLEEVQRRKVLAQVLPESAEFYPGLDLGQHDTRAAAAAALATLNRRGVRTARVVVVRSAQRLERLRVPQADGALRARLAALKLPAGLGFGACAAEAGAAPAVPATPVPRVAAASALAPSLPPSLPPSLAATGASGTQR